ncbi:DUF4271 domain-containing protein [Lunatibacter salilacus]|uniref:DUF4271 domain-containing protein n=1 Tax=Lunatibacter salilacus TaxID=2483804 RepID=UPI00131E70BC|nr:DUF4271 domain-containing protein [Lunatibacter salilacus]
MKSNRILFLVTLIFCCSFFQMGRAQVLENFNPELKVTTRGTILKTTEKLTVSIPLNSFPLSHLQVKVPEGAAVFLAGVLWDLSVSDTIYQLPMTEIQRLAPAKEEQVELVIFKPEIELGQVSVQKINFQNGEVLGAPAFEMKEEFLKRTKDDFREFFFLSVLIILLLVAIFRIVHPTVFSIFLNPRFLVTAEELTDTTITSRFFSSALLFYLLVVNLVLILIAISGLYFLDVDLGAYTLARDLNGLFFFWLLGTVIGTFVLFVKYVWLKVLSIIFSILKFEIPHFLYMLRAISLGLLVVLVVLVFSIANASADLVELTSLLIKGYFIYYLVATGMLWILMTNKLTLKNYHLFSYICTAELIPFLVITKLLMG